MTHLDYVDFDVIWSICDSVLGYLFKEREIVRTRIPNFGEPEHMDSEIYEIKDYIDMEFVATAKQMVLDYFNSAPFEYIFFAPLPQVFLPDNKPFVISEEVSLIKIEQDPESSDFPPLVTKWPPGHFSSHTLDDKDKSKEGIAYVCIKSYGTDINNHARQRKFRKARESLKVLTAALCAVGALVEDNYVTGRIIDPVDLRGHYFFYPSEEHRKPLFLEEEIAAVALTELEWGFIDKLTLNNSFMEPNPLELAAMKSGKKENSPIEQHKRLEQKLKPIRKLYISHSQAEKKQEADRVKNALYWFFEGISNTNASFSFILLTIALETLLGEPSEKKDIVKRLADRCSFLIATDAIARKEIKKDFEAAYGVRSKIIHEGRTQFDEKEMMHYTNMRKFLTEALAREIDSLPDA